ncbi:MAG TPA: MFS transporter [Acidimicrobiales bacterium]
MKRNRVILALVCGAQFMVVLDLAVVNVALPAMQADLRADPGDLQWVVTTYGLVLGGLLLLGGRAADLLGRRTVLVAGLGLFTAASLVAGLADRLGPLIAARAVQGAGGALAAPAALSILVGTFREGPERNQALGIFGAVGGSAAAVGVILSGALTSGPGWPWIFLLNVPIGVLLAALADGDGHHLAGVQVVEVAGGRVVGIHAHLDPALGSRFGLPARRRPRRGVTDTTIKLRRGERS